MSLTCGFHIVKCLDLSDSNEGFAYLHGGDRLYRACATTDYRDRIVLPLRLAVAIRPARRVYDTALEVLETRNTRVVPSV